MAKMKEGYLMPRVQMRWFVCPVCKQKMMAPKDGRYGTARGHRKTMWCWKCEKTRCMIQIN